MVSTLPSSFSVALRPQRLYGLLGTGSPGRPPRPSHSSCALKCRVRVQSCFTSIEIIRTIMGVHKVVGTLNVCVSVAQDGYLDFHTTPELCLPASTNGSLSGALAPFASSEQKSSLSSIRHSPATNSPFSPLQFSSRRYTCARKAHMLSAPSLRRFPTVAFETVLMFV